MTDTTQAAPPRPVGVVPYLLLEGAEDAIALYTRAFGAETVNLMPAEDGKRLMHACLNINGGALMMSDVFPEHGVPLEKPQGYILHLQLDDVQAWWDRAVGAGLEVVAPLKKEFWGDHYGQLRDSFGVLWSLGGAG